MKGRFIAFEGCEGAGKSTQIRLLSEYLKEKNIPCLITREPGGGKISEEIRRIILDGKNTEMSDSCEALLYAAARAQHLSDTVAPALERGEFVLCDRYIFSTFAYQGYGRGMDMGFLKDINRFALERYMPDLTLILDIPSERAFERKHGADEEDRMEQAGGAFHSRVYGGYRKLLKEYEGQMVAVDCSGTKYETSAKIAELLRARGFFG